MSSDGHRQLQAKHNAKPALPDIRYIVRPFLIRKDHFPDIGAMLDIKQRSQIKNKGPFALQVIFIPRTLLLARFSQDFPAASPADPINPT